LRFARASTAIRAFVLPHPRLSVSVANIIILVNYYK
jgi:hypothetical protein